MLVVLHCIVQYRVDFSSVFNIKFTTVYSNYLLIKLTYKLYKYREDLQYWSYIHFGKYN